MKISVLITEGAKQVMLKPENTHEREALKMIAPNDVLVAESKWGQYENEYSHKGLYPDLSNGGYYREYQDSEALMFIIKNKENKNENN